MDGFAYKLDIVCVQNKLLIDYKYTYFIHYQSSSLQTNWNRFSQVIKYHGKG